MAINPTSTGGFTWSSIPHLDAPPDNIQQYDYLLSAKANEIKNNADFLHSNIETCFNEKLTLCSSNETTQYDTRYQINYTDDRSVQYTANQNTDKSLRYDSVEETYCGTQRSTLYYSQYLGRYSVDQVSRAFVNITVNSLAGCGNAYFLYHGTVQTDHYTTDNENHDATKHNFKYDTEHSTYNSDVKSNVKSVEHLDNRTTVCVIL